VLKSLTILINFHSTETISQCRNIFTVSGTLLQHTITALIHFYSAENHFTVLKLFETFSICDHSPRNPLPQFKRF